MRTWEETKQSTVTDLVDGDVKGYFNSLHVMQITPSGWSKSQGCLAIPGRKWQWQKRLQLSPWALPAPSSSIVFEISSNLNTTALNENFQCSYWQDGASMLIKQSHPMCGLRTQDQWAKVQEQPEWRWQTQFLLLRPLDLCWVHYGLNWGWVQEEIQDL